MNAEEINEYLHRKRAELKRRQDKDGKWNFPFQGPILTDCFMIAIIRTLKLNETDLMASLVNRLLRTQQENGSWKLYPDELDGNLSATVQAYASLLMSGEFHRGDEEMKRAEQFIEQHGLAYIRPPDNGNNGFHRLSLLFCFLNYRRESTHYSTAPFTPIILYPPFSGIASQKVRREETLPSFKAATLILRRRT